MSLLVFSCISRIFCCFLRQGLLTLQPSSLCSSDQPSTLGGPPTSDSCILVTGIHHDACLVWFLRQRLCSVACMAFNLFSIVQDCFTALRNPLKTCSAFPYPRQSLGRFFVSFFCFFFNCLYRFAFSQCIVGNTYVYIYVYMCICTCTYVYICVCILISFYFF